MLWYFFLSGAPKKNPKDPKLTSFFAHYFRLFRKSCKRVTAFLVAVIYAVSTHASSLEAAHGVRQESSPALTIELDNFRIPSRIGTVQEILKSTRRETVFLIQDAHSIPAAQKNISKMLQYLSRTWGVSAVGLEGASGDLDPTVFKTYPEKARLKTFLTRHLAQGEIPGSILALLSTEGARTRFSGMEDWALYEEAVSLYLAALNGQELLLKKIENEIADLEVRKKNTYPPELLEIDRAEKEFNNSPDLLPKLLLVLSRLAPPEKGSALEAVVRDLQMNDTEELSAEIARALQLVRNPSRHPEKKLNSKLQAYQTRQLPEAAFLAFLADFAEKQGVALSLSEAAQGSVENWRRMNALKGDVFYRDLKKYLQKSKRPYLASVLLRQLDLETRKLALLSKLAKLELTHEEWVEISGRDLKGFGNALDSNFAFYRNSEQRDEAFFQKLQALINRGSEKAVAFVGGGFHVPGLSARLTRAGFNVVILQPKIEVLPGRILYREHMRGNVSWKKDLIGEGGGIRIYDSFLNHFKKSLLDSSVENPGVVQKAWHDEIIRELASSGRIERAGEYLKQVSREAGQALKPFPWRTRFEKFSTGLRLLDKENRLTEDAIFSLLNAHAIPVLESPSLAVPRSEFHTIMRAEVRGFRVQATEGTGLDRWGKTVRNVNIIIADDLMKPINRFIAAYPSDLIREFNKARFTNIGLPRLVAKMSGHQQDVQITNTQSNHVVTVNLSNLPELIQKLEEVLNRSEMRTENMQAAVRKSWPKDFDLDQWKIETEVAQGVKGILEPFLPRSEEEVRRLIELEKAAWKTRVGVTLADDEIRARILGTTTADGREQLPTPVIVLRIDGKIEGAIFMSFVNSKEGLEGIPPTYAELVASHRPEGNTVVDYSVVSDPKSPYVLFEPLARATIALGEKLQKERLVAYSRAEFFTEHASSKYGGKDRKADLDQVFREFLAKSPAPKFEDYRHYFAMTPEEIAKFDQEGFLDRMIAARQKWGMKNLPSKDDLIRYFNLDFQDFKEYGQFHLDQAGDRFLLNFHQRLGAQIIGVLPGARPGDRRAFESSVVVEYKLTGPRAQAMRVRKALAPWRNAKGIEVLTGGKTGPGEMDEEELLALTDENGIPNGRFALRDQVHREGIWHQTVHVHLFYQGKMLVQLRNWKKTSSPGKLQVGVSGHLNASRIKGKVKAESQKQGAMREGHEEIGIWLHPGRLKRASLHNNEIKRSYPLEDGGQNNEFTTAYAYELNENELAKIRIDFNLNESDELWLVPSPALEQMARETPEVLSRSLLYLFGKDRSLLEKLQRAALASLRSEARATALPPSDSADGIIARLNPAAIAHPAAGTYVPSADVEAALAELEEIQRNSVKARFFVLAYRIGQNFYTAAEESNGDDLMKMASGELIPDYIRQALSISGYGEFLKEASRSKNPWVRAGTAVMLESQAVDTNAKKIAMVQLLAEPYLPIKRLALKKLEAIVTDPKVLELLKNVLLAETPNGYGLRLAAAILLSRVRPEQYPLEFDFVGKIAPRLLPALSAGLKIKDPEIKAKALHALPAAFPHADKTTKGKIQIKELEPLLIRALEDDSESVRKEAARALKSLATPNAVFHAALITGNLKLAGSFSNAVPFSLKLLKKPGTRLHAAALEFLKDHITELSGEQAMEVLQIFLSDHRSQLGQAAAKQLRAMAPKTISRKTAELVMGLLHPHGDERTRALKALRTLYPEAFKDDKGEGELNPDLSEYSAIPKNVLPVMKRLVTLGPDVKEEPVYRETALRIQKMILHRLAEFSDGTPLSHWVKMGGFSTKSFWVDPSAKMQHYAALLSSALRLELDTQDPEVMVNLKVNFNTGDGQKYLDRARFIELAFLLRGGKAVWKLDKPIANAAFHRQYEPVITKTNGHLHYSFPLSDEINQGRQGALTMYLNDFLMLNRGLFLATAKAMYDDGIGSLAAVEFQNENIRKIVDLYKLFERDLVRLLRRKEFNPDRMKDGAFTLDSLLDPHRYWISFLKQKQEITPNFRKLNERLRDPVIGPQLQKAARELIQKYAQEIKNASEGLTGPAGVPLHEAVNVADPLIDTFEVADPSDEVGDNGRYIHRVLKEGFVPGSELISGQDLWNAWPFQNALNARAGTRSEARADDRKSEFELKLESILQRRETLTDTEALEASKWLFDKYRNDAGLTDREKEVLKESRGNMEKFSKDYALKHKLSMMKMATPEQIPAMLERGKPNMEKLRRTLLYYGSLINRILKDKSEVTVAVQIAKKGASLSRTGVLQPFMQAPKIHWAGSYGEIKKDFAGFFRYSEKVNSYLFPSIFLVMGSDAQKFDDGENWPFYLSPLLAARAAGLEAEQDFSVTAGVLLNAQNPVEKILVKSPTRKDDPPYLMIVFKEEPSKNDLRRRPMFLLNQALPHFPETDESAAGFIHSHFVFEDAQLRAFAFSETAPMPEKIEKIKALVEKISSKQVLSQDHYIYVSQEGLRRAAAFIAEDPEERLAAELGFYQILLMQDLVMRELGKASLFQAHKVSPASLLQMREAWEKSMKKIALEEEKSQEAVENYRQKLTKLGIQGPYLDSDLALAEDLEKGRYLQDIESLAFLTPFLPLLFQKDEKGVPLFNVGNLSNFLRKLKDLFSDIKKSSLPSQIQKFREELPKNLQASFDFEVLRALLDGMKSKAHEKPGIDALRKGLLQVVEKKHSGDIFITLTGNHLLQARREPLRNEITELETSLWNQFSRPLTEKTLEGQEEILDKLLQKFKLLAAIPPALSVDFLRPLVFKKSGGVLEGDGERILLETAEQLKNQAEYKAASMDWMEKKKSFYRVLLEFRKYLEEERFAEFLQNMSRLNTAVLEQGAPLSVEYHAFIQGIQKEYIRRMAEKATELSRNSQFIPGLAVLAEAAKVVGAQNPELLEARKKVERVAGEKVMRDANQLAAAGEYGNALALLDEALQGDHARNSEIKGVRNRIQSQVDSSQTTLPQSLREKAGQFLKSKKFESEGRPVAEMLEAVKNGQEGRISTKLGKFLDHWAHNQARISQGAGHSIYELYAFALEVNDILKVRQDLVRKTRSEMRQLDLKELLPQEAPQVQTTVDPFWSYVIVIGPVIAIAALYLFWRSRESEDVEKDSSAPKPQKKWSPKSKSNGVFDPIWLQKMAQRVIHILNPWTYLKGIIAAISNRKSKAPPKEKKKKPRPESGKMQRLPEPVRAKAESEEAVVSVPAALPVSAPQVEIPEDEGIRLARIFQIHFKHLLDRKLNETKRKQSLSAVQTVLVEFDAISYEAEFEKWISARKADAETIQKARDAGRQDALKLQADIRSAIQEKAEELKRVEARQDRLNELAAALRSWNTVLQSNLKTVTEEARQESEQAFDLRVYERKWDEAAQTKLADLKASHQLSDEEKKPFESILSGHRATLIRTLKLVENELKDAEGKALAISQWIEKFKDESAPAIAKEAREKLQRASSVTKNKVDRDLQVVAQTFPKVGAENVAVARDAYEKASNRFNEILNQAGTEFKQDFDEYFLLIGKRETESMEPFQKMIRESRAGKDISPRGQKILQAASEPAEENLRDIFTSLREEYDEAYSPLWEGIQKAGTEQFNAMIEPFRKDLFLEIQLQNFDIDLSTRVNALLTDEDEKLALNPERDLDRGKIIYDFQKEVDGKIASEMESLEKDYGLKTEKKEKDTFVRLKEKHVGVLGEKLQGLQIRLESVSQKAGEIVAAAEAARGSIQERRDSSIKALEEAFRIKMQDLDAVSETALVVFTISFDRLEEIPALEEKAQNIFEEELRRLVQDFPRMIRHTQDDLEKVGKAEKMALDLSIQEIFQGLHADSRAAAGRFEQKMKDADIGFAKLVQAGQDTLKNSFDTITAEKINAAVVSFNTILSEIKRPPNDPTRRAKINEKIGEILTPGLDAIGKVPDSLLLGIETEQEIEALDEVKDFRLLYGVFEPILTKAAQEDWRKKIHSRLERLKYRWATLRMNRAKQILKERKQSLAEIRYDHSSSVLNHPRVLELKDFIGKNFPEHEALTQQQALDRELFGIASRIWSDEEGALNHKIRGDAALRNTDTILRDAARNIEKRIADSAEKSLRVLLKLPEDSAANHPIFQARAFLLLAAIYKNAGKMAEARAAIRSALKIDPLNPDALLDGLYLTREAPSEEAEQPVNDFERPFHSKRYDEALTILKKLLDRPIPHMMLRWRAIKIKIEVMLQMDAAPRSIMNVLNEWARQSDLALYRKNVPDFDHEMNRLRRLITERIQREPKSEVRISQEDDLKQFMVLFQESKMKAVKEQGRYGLDKGKFFRFFRVQAGIQTQKELKINSAGKLEGGESGLSANALEIVVPLLQAGYDLRFGTGKIAVREILAEVFQVKLVSLAPVEDKESPDAAPSPVDQALSLLTEAERLSNEGALGELIKLFRTYDTVIPRTDFKGVRPALLVQIEAHPLEVSINTYKEKTPMIIQRLERKFEGHTSILPVKVKELLLQAEKKFLTNQSGLLRSGEMRLPFRKTLDERSEVRGSLSQIHPVARLDAEIIRGEKLSRREIREAAGKTRQLLSEEGMGPETFLDQVEAALLAVEGTGSLIPQDVYETETRRLMDFIRAYLQKHPDSAFRLALDLPPAKSRLIRDNQLDLYADALRQFGAFIKSFVIRGKIQGPAGKNLLNTLRELKLSFANIRKWTELRAGEDEIIPAVTPENESASGEAVPVFLIGMEGRTNDPRVRAYGALLQFALAIVTADGLQTRPEKLRKDSQVVRAELLKSRQTLLRALGFDAIRVGGRGASVFLESVEAGLLQSMRSARKLQASA